jgi:predicted PurR-regulated permease PerM
MDSDPPNDKPPNNIQNYVFGAILILLFVLVCRLFAHFFTVLLWSILLYVLMSPLHKRITKKIDDVTTRGSILKNIWAGVFALGTVILILIPLFFVVFQFLKQIIELIRYIQGVFVNKPDIIQDIFNYMSKFVSNISGDQINISTDEIQHRIMIFLSSSLQGLFQFSSSIARDVGYFLLGLAFMVFCLFFFYIDGPYLSHLALHSIPIRKDYMVTLVGKFMDITRNLFLGYIMVSLVQAVLAGIIFSIFQIKGALVFAALTFICVFIPMIGGGLVWLPLGIIQILSGSPVRGVIFLIVSAFFISTVDNFLRPMFLQNRIKLHPLIIFFAILGGVSSFGFNGLVLGPMIVILFLTVLDMFLMEHKIE